MVNFFPPELGFINLHLYQMPRITHLLEEEKQLIGSLWCQTAWGRTLPLSFKDCGALNYFIILSVTLFLNSNHQNKYFMAFVWLQQHSKHSVNTV